MLCSPDLGQPSGDCVFIAVPGQAELFDTPAADLLFQRREAGESSWRVVNRKPITVVVRTPGLPDELYIEFDSGAGQWGVVSGSDRKVIGRALLPPSTEPGAAADPAS
jgi:hypothetical protein